MKIGIVGLGKMGLMLAKNLQDNQLNVIGYDIALIDQKDKEGITLMKSLKALSDALDERKIFWMMLPAGDVTRTVFEEILSLCSNNDIIIDAGNSFYQDSIDRYNEAKVRGINFLDVGTSGGVSGARNGACMMVGGDIETFEYLEDVFEKVNVKDGYLYCGEAGSGHFLKMVHNGIEYGMMQSIAEGFNLLNHSKFDYDLNSVAKVFNNGSVIRGWLMELTENLLKDDKRLDDIEGIAYSSGEGTWTVQEALKLKVQVPVIAQSVFVRFSSEDECKYGEKIIASLRNQFGGHYVKSK